MLQYKAFAVTQLSIILRGLIRHTRNFFEVIALGNIRGSEMTFQGHSMTSKMAQFDEEHTTSY